MVLKIGQKIKLNISFTLLGIPYPIYLALFNKNYPKPIMIRGNKYCLQLQQIIIKGYEKPYFLFLVTFTILGLPISGFIINK